MAVGTPQQKALSLIKGQKLLLPNLYDALPGWDGFQGGDCSKRVNNAVESWTQSWTNCASILKTARAGRFGLLARCFYPDAEEEAVFDMACYLVWIFVWDDKFDKSVTSIEFGAAKQLQDETLRLLNHLFNDAPWQDPKTLDAVNRGFFPICAKIAARSASEARKRILHDLEAFVDSVTDWFRRDDGSMPTVAEHYANRDLNAGVRPTIALIEYCYGLDIPSSIMEHESLQEIKERATEIVMIANDLASIRPEITEGRVGNIVAVLAYNEGMSAQEAMDHAFTLLQKAHAAFEAAERRLPLPSGDAAVDQDVRKFVLGCKHVCTGNIHWSYNSYRYHGEDPVREKGKIVIQL
ncbi:isoprenoid synthase domain-containing protein [Sphaerosporella brunnea]|uniref:Terpene synthase n=1 Tax=Sphaerosporella brunnea TaxID=1250544 RepID=A0A5J5EYJ2_9PEZI|nr:isoprenoid synthase domain-containing protein [Sphaerosporella brunnea]